MQFRQLIDAATSTYTYLLADAQTKEAVIIDPVLEQFDRDAALIEQLGLTLVHVLETHVHADHVTSAALLRDRFGAKTVLSQGAGVGCADRLVAENDEIHFGRHMLRVRATPGHTNGDLVFVLGDESMAFTGDTLLVRGCGRTDFQEGDARALYRAVREKIFRLPAQTRLYPGHDYRGHTVTTVAEERAHNPRLADGVTEDEFVETMAALNLPHPSRIDVSLAANVHCGRLPTSQGRISQVAQAEQWAPVERTEQGTPEVGVSWLAAEPTSGELLVVDVRQPEEWTGPLGHIEGAELVPLDTLGAAASWEHDKPIVVVCRSGKRSAAAARLLEEKGYTQVASLRGGMQAWNLATASTSA